MSEFNKSEIKVVFIDIGGVLLTNGWDYESREKASEIFKFDLQEMNTLHNFIYNVFEIGSISLDQYLDTILFHTPRDFTKMEFREFMFSRSIELPNLLKWLKEWKTQTDLPVFALSNENLDLNEYRIQTFKLHELFDGFFSSCYLGVQKPDPRIFKMAMDITQFKPDECIYFDDIPMFVNTAKNLGMNSILHENFETTKNILENFIIK